MLLTWLRDIQIHKRNEKKSSEKRKTNAEKLREEKLACSQQKLTSMKLIQ